MKTFHLTAFWDDDAKVWTTAASDIPGLVVESDSFEDFLTLAESLAPELAADNLAGAIGPFVLVVEARHEVAVQSR